MSDAIQEIEILDDSVHAELNPVEVACYPKVCEETDFRTFPSDSEDDSDEADEDDGEVNLDTFAGQHDHIMLDAMPHCLNAPTGPVREEEYLPRTNTQRKRKLSLPHPDHAVAKRRNRKSYLVCDGVDYVSNLRGESARYQLDLRELSECGPFSAWQRHEREVEIEQTHLRQIRTLKRMFGVVDEEVVRAKAARKKAEAEVAAMDWAEEDVSVAGGDARPRDEVPSILCTSSQENEAGFNRTQQETIFYEDVEGEPEVVERKDEVRRYEAQLEAFHCSHPASQRRRSDDEKDMWEAHIQTLVNIKTRRQMRIEKEHKESKLAQDNSGVIRHDGCLSLIADDRQNRSELPEAGASQLRAAPKLVQATTASVAKQDTEKSSVVAPEPIPPMTDDDVHDSNDDHPVPSIEHAQPSFNRAAQIALRDTVKNNGTILQALQFVQAEIQDIKETRSIAIAAQKSQQETDQQTLKRLQVQADRYRQERNDAWETAESYLAQRDQALDDRNAAYETGEIWVRERDEAWRLAKDPSMRLAHLNTVVREA